ncbi:hypothetical protein XENTR_v10005695 [Xenopus tropicalis]|uniref:Interleukin family protein n=1 Tax=Xenopus tropicalis TaxID=8364 RepID=F7CQQ3_XENTR|nr:interleukin-10 precursor [Xenopus tropicalis]ABN54796.1 IL10 protein [Xenopus tropicalis]KAE8623685.1 hypothetical protein XENTR_v10005695 [Xenopus tropicalis]|eukprot:NP_001165400.1 interleukin-10 precursor [Xenopus tropicalis]
MKFCLLLTLFFFTCKTVKCQSGDAEGNCSRVVNIFPAKLKELRATFQKIKNFFQMKDNALEIVLLQDDLLQEFKGNLGCQSVSETIRFYLEEVLPQANHYKMNVSFLKDKLLDLKHTLRRCHNFLPCERKSKAIKQIKQTYNKMHEQGIYKAMGEFDILIDYIEDYLMSRKK